VKSIMLPLFVARTSYAEDGSDRRPGAPLGLRQPMTARAGIPYSPALRFPEAYVDRGARAIVE
jgi:hypothetical protein